MLNSIYGFNGQFRFLSNFYSAVIVIDGTVWASVEHVYQASKCKHPKDAVQFLSLRSPGQAKRIGSTVRLREDWDLVKVGLMTRFVQAKFAQNEDLKKLLLATEPRQLEETNTWGDVFWGVCNGVGKNNLGRILMEVRGTLC